MREEDAPGGHEAELDEREGDGLGEGIEDGFRGGVGQGRGQIPYYTERLGGSSDQVVARVSNA